MDIHSLNLLSSKEAAQLIRVSISAFHYLVTAYNIPHQTLSNGKIFLQEDIEAFQESRKDKLKHRPKKHAK